MSTSYTRRGFIQSAGVIGLAGLIPALPSQALGGLGHGPSPDLVLDPDEGEVYLIGERPGEPWKGLTGEDWARINAEFGITYRR